MCPGHNGKWIPATRQVLIHFPFSPLAGNQQSCESNSLRFWIFIKGLECIPAHNKTVFRWFYFYLSFPFPPKTSAENKMGKIILIWLLNFYFGWIIWQDYQCLPFPHQHRWGALEWPADQIVVLGTFQGVNAQLCEWGQGFPVKERLTLGLNK